MTPEQALIEQRAALAAYCEDGDIAHQECAAELATVSGYWIGDQEQLIPYYHPQVAKTAAIFKCTLAQAHAMYRNNAAALQADYNHMRKFGIATLRGYSLDDMRTMVIKYQAFAEVSNAL